MRIAVISDIHGNLAALEATLEHLDTEDIDEVVVAGDLVNGAADSLACWRLVRSLGYPLLRGNHERYLFDLGTPNEQSEWQTERFAPVHWAARQFAAADLNEMRDLPLCHRLEDFPELLIVHAAPHSDRVDVHPDMPDSEVAPLFDTVSARLIVRGHNHVFSSRRLGRQLLVTAGSVGMPLDGDVDAKYVLLERTKGDWEVEHRAVPYDVEATVRRFSETGYLDEAGPMAVLMLREITTGKHQMTPFLRNWLHCPASERAPLAEAVESYLNADW